MSDEVDESLMVVVKDYLWQEGDPFSKLEERPAPEGWVVFTLWDDDNELYFECAVPNEDLLEEAWNWGAWYAGTTMLKVGGELVIG